MNEMINKILSSGLTVELKPEGYGYPAKILHPKLLESGIYVRAVILEYSLEDAYNEAVKREWIK